LRTGNDLRDQADLASARSVTTGSWFSDCIGASGLLVVVGSQGLSSAKLELSPLAERSGISATSGMPCTLTSLAMGNMAAQLPLWTVRRFLAARPKLIQFSVSNSNLNSRMSKNNILAMVSGFGSSVLYKEK
jgi:hypothetical protein